MSGNRSRWTLGGASLRPTRRLYLVTSAVLGIAAVILGLVLAAAPATSPPVVAVAALPAARPSAAQLSAMVGQARSQQAGLLLLVAETPQQAAATMDAISGHIPPPAAAAPRATEVISGPPVVSVVFSPSGTDAVIRQLPASVQVIGVAGNPLRPAATPGGRGGLVLLWACMLLAFGYLVTRAVAVPRAAPAPPGPGEFIPPAPGLPAADAAARLRASYDILARHQPRTPLDGWQPQCPWCGSFTLQAVADQGYVCLSCGHDCPAADRESWPDTVLSHRRQNPAQPYPQT